MTASSGGPSSCFLQKISVTYLQYCSTFFPSQVLSLLILLIANYISVSFVSSFQLISMVECPQISRVLLFPLLRLLEDPQFLLISPPNQRPCPAPSPFALRSSATIEVARTLQVLSSCKIEGAGSSRVLSSCSYPTENESPRLEISEFEVHQSALDNRYNAPTETTNSTVATPRVQPLNRRIGSVEGDRKSAVKGGAHRNPPVYGNLLSVDFNALPDTLRNDKKLGKHDADADIRKNSNPLSSPPEFDDEYKKSQTLPNLVLAKSHKHQEQAVVKKYSISSP